MPSANTARWHVQGVFPMGKNVLCYKTSMHIFKKWLGNGWITADELLELETMLAGEYGLLEYSIYREKGETDGNCNQKQPLCMQNL
jgi:hypothetical protein